jgi:hypothetical protein
MALVGRLEDLRLAEIFQVLALFRKSGTLTLSRGDATGVFLFNEGKVFHASNGYSSPALGDFLVDRKLISQETLNAAVATQRLSEKRKKLGAILVDMGAISYETLQEVLRDQLQNIARDFLRWDSGFFNFKAVDSRDEDQQKALHDDEAKLNEFINVDPFILDLLTKVDAVGGDGTVRPVPRPTTDPPYDDESIRSVYDLLNYMVEPGHSAFRPDPSDVITEWPSDLAELRKLMAEIQVRPSATMGEVALLILRYATHVVNRGALFGVSSEGISGIGQFGVGRGDDQAPLVDRKIREILIPGDEPSVFSGVIETKSTYHGKLLRSPWNNYLVDQLGGTVPPEVVVTPIVVNGRVSAAFYGDNLPGGHPITSIHGLELLMIEAGLAIERNVLAEKLKWLEETVAAVTRDQEEGRGEGG